MVNAGEAKHSMALADTAGRPQGSEWGGGGVSGLLTDVKGIQKHGSSNLLTANSIPATTSMADFCSVGTPSDT